jgi:hypothetical protein
MAGSPVGANWQSLTPSASRLEFAAADPLSCAARPSDHAKFCLFKDFLMMRFSWRES